MALRPFVRQTVAQALVALLFWQSALPLELLASPAPAPEAFVALPAMPAMAAMPALPAPQPPAYQAPVPAAACPSPGGSPSAAELIYLGAVSGTCGDPLDLAARLADRCGNGLAGRAISFSIGSETATATTDANGLARAAFTPAAAAAALPLEVRFAGDADHLAAEDSAGIEVARKAALVRFTGGPTLGLGIAEPVSALLLDARSGRPLAGKTLEFGAGPAKVSATTGADGIATASLTLPAGSPTGPLSLAVSFAGDGCHDPAADTAGIFAYLPASFVVWGGNREGLRLGQRVNFWGHSWPKQVTAGDYGASGDFKGHAPSVAGWQVCQPRATTRGTLPLDASCWSSKPGQSFPPETLPDHIGVIVATSIGKERGTDFGNVAALAVVRVDADPPYGPVPGKPGFGTLVAVIADGAGLFPEPPRTETSQSQPAAESPATASRLTLPWLAAGLVTPVCASPGTRPFTLRWSNLGSAAAAGAEADLTFPDGTAAKRPLGPLGPGESAASVLDWSVPAIPPKSDEETNEGYLARLAAADWAPLSLSAALAWTDGLGNPYGPVEARCSTAVALPILSYDVAAPDFLLPGERADLAATVRNTGRGNAFQATLRAGAEDPSPFDLPAGGSAPAPVVLAAPGISRGPGEPEPAYRTRLEQADDSPLEAPLTLAWKDVVGNVYGPLVGALHSTWVLPIVPVALSGPDTVQPGEVFSYAVEVIDIGHAGAVAIEVELTLPDGSVRSMAFGDLAPEAELRRLVEFALPASQPPGEITARAMVRWRDARGTEYGPLTAAVATAVVVPNEPPEVDAGPDRAVVLPALTALQGTASDDGRPAGSVLALAWTVVSGPGAVTFGDPDQAVTSAAFGAPGVYVLRLTANDSELSASDDTAATVTEPATGPPVFHQDADLGGGDTVNLARDPYGHLHVVEKAEPFHFLWVAVSSKGTVVKIDTDTGQVLGEYWTSPSGQPKDPSRTTVDHNGNVWATNRAGNSVLRIGLLENGQCLDRNGNGTIDTSTKLGDVRAWTNAGGVDTDGGVDTAADECILNYVRVSSSGTRHVSVTAANDVWVSGTGNRRFDLLDGKTGEIKRRETSVGYGGYGGLIDEHGVIWSARHLLRWDTALSLKGANGGNWRGYGHDSYGLCLDSHGNVWNTSFGGNWVRKFAPDGTLLGSFHHGANGAQGCAVDGNDHVWVAHSLNGSTVGHLLNDGTLVGSVRVGAGPTGVAVDALGKVWATNYHSRTVSRIDPEAGPIGADGATPVGEVDFTSVNLKGNLYDYSDMTGSTLRGVPDGGTWSRVFDTGDPGAEWGVVAWSGNVCGDGELAVTAASSADGVSFGTPVPAVNGGGLALPAGRFLKVEVRFRRAASGESPFLHALSVGTRGWVPPAAPAPVLEVDAGLDQTTTLPNAASLVGHVCATGRIGGRLPIAWSRVSGPGEVVFARPSLPVTDAAPAEPGEYVLRLAVGDVADEVTVVALEANDPPAVEAGADRTIALPAALDLAGTVTDDGRPAASTLALSWSVVSGPSDVDFADPAAAVTTASFREPGSYRLRLAADDSNLVGLDELAVTVVPANDAPAVNAGPDQTVRLPAKASLDATVSDDGRPAGVALRLTWSKVSGPGTVSFGNTAVADTTATFSVAGSYVLRLTATDSQLSTADDVAVTVLPANQRPVVNAGPNQTIELPAATTLRGTASDDGVPEGGSLTLAWSKVSGPGFVTFADPATAETAASFSDPGSYVLRLTANDGALAATDDVAVTVRPSTVNLPPTVSAGPDQTVEHPAAATLRGQAGDDRLPAGSVLTLAWSQASGPGGVTFSAPAALTTTATFTAPGEYVLELAASDSVLSSRDQVIVTVLPQNFPPLVSAGPDQSTGIPGPPLSLQGSVTDDGLPAGGMPTATWSKVSGPGTVTFADPASAATTAAFSATGSYVLRLTASDSRRNATDDVAVTVVRANQAPAVDAGADLTLHLPNAASLKGVVRDDGLPAGQKVKVTWSRVDGPGTVTFGRTDATTTTATFSAAGTYRLRLTATDTQLEASDEVAVEVRPPPPPPPAVAITSPADGGEITGPFDVVGSVSHGTWKLETSQGVPVGSPEPAVWTTIASGNTPVANGVLGTFDPTLLLNGTYVVRLTATDAEGQTVSVVRTAVVTGEQKIGHFTLTFEDLSVPVAGLPIQVLRTYDSRDKRQGDFGIGWTLSLKNVRLEKSAVLGLYWRQSILPGTLPQYCLQPTRPNTVTITFPDGRVFKFQATVSKQCQAVVPLTGARFGFTPMPGTRGSLVPEGPLDVLVGGGAPSPVELLNAADPLLNVYDPNVFRLTTAEGFVYVIDRKTGVRSVTDPNGNRLTVSADGVIHSSGKSIRFVRDAAGRIAQIVDPLGNPMSYAYDANGDLVSYKDREAHETKFTYNGNHHILDIIDPRGVRAVRNDYDENGRLIAHTDGLGKKITYEHDLAGRREVVTDRLGNTTVYEYDAGGNFVRETDPLGGVTAHTYDSRGNELSRTDPLGNTSRYAYDVAGNLTRDEDPLGHATLFAYNARGQRLSQTDPLGRITALAYDGRGNLSLMTLPNGEVFSHTYTANGLLTSITDPAGGVWHFEHGGGGLVIRKVDPLGNAMVSTYDAAGNRLTKAVTRTLGGQSEILKTAFEYDRSGLLVASSFPDGSARRTFYDALGNTVSEVDTLGRPTFFERDATGKLVRTTYPDGTVEESAFDADGRRLAHTGRAGHITRFVYDSLGRLVEVLVPDGSRRTSTHDAAGRLVEAMDETRRVSRFDYDAAGRLVRKVDSAGGITTYERDPAGSVVRRIGPDGGSVRYEYDTRGRNTAVVLADGTRLRVSFDPSGHTVTDPEGRTTRRVYDTLGRLVQVTDAAGGMTRYRYDEVGNLVAQVDANEHETAFDYDRMGRQTRRTLPLGMTETFSYDAAGNLVSRTDFNGKNTLYRWDVMNRLMEVAFDPRLGQLGEVYSYTPTGRRARRVDASGTTTWTYDDRDRVVRKETSQGALTYTYDEAGRVLSVRSSNPGGIAVRYTWDEMGRLATVSEDRSGAGVTSYAYNPAGDLAEMTYPNGVRTRFSYDAARRLTELSLGRGEELLARWAYEVGPSGRRRSVTELSGRRVEYSLDALDRLTGERITGERPESEGIVTYLHDAVGNRLRRDSTLPGLRSAEHAYDANDRLLGDLYDDQGNTLRAGAFSLSYDAAGRLSGLADGSVVFVYDGDGNRVAKTIGGRTVHYLVDEINPTGLPQVVEEITDGQVQRVYVYGRDLISQRWRAADDWQIRWYGHDGQRSVRLLTDEAGAVTDRYDYDAFGNLLAREGSTPNDYLYAGQRHDLEMGLVYLRARYLDPTTGRFLTLDPDPGHLWNPISLHRYIYADGSPVDLADPTGRMSTYMFAIVMLSIILVGIIPIAWSVTNLALSISGLSAPERTRVRAALDLIKNGGETIVGPVLEQMFRRGRIKRMDTEAYGEARAQYNLITLPLGFFDLSGIVSPINDVERAAILLHEGAHIQGAGDSWKSASEAYAQTFVWVKKDRISWTADRYGEGRVNAATGESNPTDLWLSAKWLIKIHAPDLLVCDEDPGIAVPRDECIP